MDFVKALFLILAALSTNARAENAEGSSLLRAIEQGNLPRALSLLTQGHSPNQVVQGSSLPIMVALFETPSLTDEQRLELLEALLTRGANTEAKDKDGNTALLLAAKGSCNQCVQRLIEAEANVNAQSLEHQTPLLLAVSNANLTSAKLLLKAGAGLRVKNAQGEGVLHLALSPGEKEQDPIRAELVKMLLEYGAGVDERTDIVDDFGGYSALHFAARNNFPEAMKVLVQRGAKINAESAHGITPLMLAVRNGHVAFVREFLAFKPAVNKLSDSELGAIHYAVLSNKEVMDSERAEIIELLAGAEANLELANRRERTALSLAASNNLLMSAKALIKLEAYLETESNDGRTPLFYAVEKGHQEMVQLLLSYQANPDAKNHREQKALHKAAEKNLVEISQALLDAGADVNAVNQAGWTSILIATHKGHLEVGQLLVEQGADVNLASYDGWMPLHLVASKKKEMEPERLAQLTTVLVKAGTNLNALNVRGYTPLLMAAVSNQAAVAKIMLEAGAAVDFRRDEKMATPLLMAVFRGHVETVQMLLAYSPDLTATTGKYGWSPLIAVSGTRDSKNRERGEIAKLLLEAGADPELTLVGGRNALMNAAEENKLEVVKVLIEAGVNPYSQNFQDSNRTALDYALSQGHQQIIDYLESLN